MISWSQRYDKLIIYEILHGGIFISFDKCIFFLNKINVLAGSYSFHSFYLSGSFECSIFF
jgi:hypothetical protein